MPGLAPTQPRCSERALYICQSNLIRWRYEPDPGLRETNDAVDGDDVVVAVVVVVVVVVEATIGDDGDFPFMPFALATVAVYGCQKEFGRRSEALLASEMSPAPCLPLGQLQILNKSFYLPP